MSSIDLATLFKIGIIQVLNECHPIKDLLWYNKIAIQYVFYLCRRKQQKTGFRLSYF